MKGIPHKILKDGGSDSCTVYLYGFIGQRPSLYDGDKSEDITDVEFLKVVKECERKGINRLDVRINSPGGSVLHMDGIMAQMQSTSMEVHTWVDGLAASAAADIFLAAKKEDRHMARNGKLMIHGPMSMVYGTAKEMREAAAALDVFEAGAVAQMASDTGLSEEEVRATYYDGSDHWLTAQQALKLGLTGHVEGYEAEKMPKDPEKMSAADLVKFFNEPQEREAVGLFKKLFQSAFPEKVTETPEPEIEIEIMNIENLKKSVTDGDIQTDDIAKYLQEQGFTVEKATPPAAPEAPDVAKIVADAVAPLKAELAEMQKKLDTTAGDPNPALPKAEGGDVADPGDPDDEASIALKAAHADVAWAKNWG